MRSMAFKAALAALIVSFPMTGAFALGASEGFDGGAMNFSTAPLAGQRPMAQPPATTATINTMPVHRHHHRHHHNQHRYPNKAY